MLKTSAAKTDTRFSWTFLCIKLHTCVLQKLAGSAMCSLARQNLNLLSQQSLYLSLAYSYLCIESKKVFQHDPPDISGRTAKEKGIPLETSWYLGRRKLLWGNSVRSAAQTSHGRWCQIYNESRWLEAAFVPLSFFAAGRYSMCCLMQRWVEWALLKLEWVSLMVFAVVGHFVI